MSSARRSTFYQEFVVDPVDPSGGGGDPDPDAALAYVSHSLEPAPPVKGNAFSCDLTVKANVDGTYFVMAMVDGQQRDELGFIDMNAGDQLRIGLKLGKAPSQQFKLTLQGGKEATQ